MYPKTEYAYTKHEGNLDLNNIAYVAYLESVQSSLFIHESPRVIFKFIIHERKLVFKSIKAKRRIRNHRFM